MDEQDLYQAQHDVDMDSRPQVVLPVENSAESSTIPAPTPDLNGGLLQLGNDFAHALNNMAISLEKPPKYAGKRTNDAVTIWLQRMELYLAQREHVQGSILTPYQQILLVSSFLEKEALNWHLLIFSSTMPVDTTYGDWTRQLAFRFRDVRTQQTRRDQWDALIQTGSAGEYAQRIQTDAMHLLPIPTENDMLLLFKRGMKNEIRDRVERLPDDLLPIDYAAYTAFADKQELELKANRTAADRRKNGKTNSHRSPPISSVSRTEVRRDADGDIVMQLNAAQARTTKVEQDAWFTDCRARNACYNCGKAGHKGAECAEPPHLWRHEVSTTMRGRGRGRGRGYKVPRGSGNARRH
jgi:hypothetical protein